MEGIIVLDQGVEIGRKKSAKIDTNQLINSEALQPGEINIKIKDDKNSINNISKFKNVLENNIGLIDINVNTLLKKNTILARRKTINDIPQGKSAEVS